jgi:hypothetical protein
MTITTGRREFKDGDGEHRLFWYATSDRLIYWKRDLEIRYWCMQQWGTIPWDRPRIWDCPQEGTFTFKEESQLIMFRMRWLEELGGA